MMFARSLFGQNIQGFLLFNYVCFLLWTSKTYTHCGHVNQKLGGSKVFTYPDGGHSFPRDYNGAFGILLKALGDTASISYEGDSAIVTLSGNRRVNVS
jgi:putative transposase